MSHQILASDIERNVCQLGRRIHFHMRDFFSELAVIHSLTSFQGLYKGL